MDNLFFDILVFLKDKEIGVDIELKEYFLSNKRLDKDIIDDKKKLVSTLKSLESKKLIKYQTSTMHNLRSVVNADDKDVTIEQLHSVLVHITFDGYDFITKYLKEIRQDKMLSDSQSIAKKAMIVSLISALTAFFSFLIDIKKEVLDKKEDIQIIQEQQQLIDSLTQSLKSLTKNSYHLLFDTSFSKVSFYIDTTQKQKR